MPRVAQLIWLRTLDGALHIRSVAEAVFGKAITSRNDEARAREQHGQPVEAERDATVRRSAVGQGVDEEAEAGRASLPR